MDRPWECECGCGQPAPVAKITSTAKGWKKGEPLRFVRGHASKGRGKRLDEWWNVDSAGCWVWNGGTTCGYGTYHPRHGEAVRAHRYVYEQLVGTIPEGLVLDHLCAVKACVNPAHLEPVLPEENTRRHRMTVTHCKRGHEFTDENTYRYKEQRQCRTCRKAARQPRSD